MNKIILIGTVLVLMLFLISSCAGVSSEEYAKVSANLTAAQSEIKALQSRSSLTEGELQTVKSQLFSMESELQTMKNELSARKTEIETVRSQLEVTTEKLKQYKPSGSFKSSVQAYMSAATQAIPHRTITKINLDVTTWDGLGEFDADNHRIVVKEAGDYIIFGLACYDTMGIIDAATQARIHVNGNYEHMYYVYLTGGCRWNYAMGTFRLAAGDYVELFTYQTSGSSQNIHGEDIIHTYLSMIRVN